MNLGDIREMGVQGVLIYCADFRCSHSIAISADRWPDDVRAHQRDALNRHYIRAFNPKGKEPHWGWRKLASDDSALRE